MQCKSVTYDWLETKSQSQQALSPKSNDGSTLTDLQRSWPLKRILVTAPLPPLLEPPVSRTCPGPTKEVAIPSPSIQTGMGRTLRAMGLQDGQMDGTGDTEGKQTNKTSQSHKRHNWSHKPHMDMWTKCLKDVKWLIDIIKMCLLAVGTVRGN